MSLDKMRLLAIATLVLLIVLLLLIPATVYVVDPREMAVVLQFGNPVTERIEPGLYFRVPFVQEVRTLPRTRQFWGDNPSDTLPDLPTKDDKKIEITPWAVWRITEPTVFVQRLRTVENAEQRVAQFVRSAIRDVVTNYDLAELVRSSSRALNTSVNPDLNVLPQGDELAAERVKVRIEHGRHKILDQIKQSTQKRLASSSAGEGGARGLEVVDVGISQIEFVDSVRQKTFDRWIAERQAISARNINEGERSKQEILNKTTADVQRIEGEGQRRSNELRGQVDAEVIRKYAQAIQEAGDFYTFVRTLEAYKQCIGRDTRLIFTTDSEFLQMLKRLDTPSPPTTRKAAPD